MKSLIIGSEQEFDFNTKRKTQPYSLRTFISPVRNLSTCSPQEHLNKSYNLLVTPLRYDGTPLQEATRLKSFWATSDVITTRSIFVNASYSVEEFDHVLIEIDFPGSKKSLRIRGIVNFVEKGSGFRVRFLALSSLTQQYIQSLREKSLHSASCALAAS